MPPLDDGRTETLPRARRSSFESLQGCDIVEVDKRIVLLRIEPLSCRPQEAAAEKPALGADSIRASRLMPLAPNGSTMVGEVKLWHGVEVTLSKSTSGIAPDHDG
jgi:hypothetical protein